VPPAPRLTVRFGPRTHRIVEQAAQASCVPLAQYVREAVLIRAAYEAGIGAGPDAQPRFAELMEAIRELMREHGEDLSADRR
jgi:hypothetical protein